jgi:hypothetical protein
MFRDCRTNCGRDQAMSVIPMKERADAGRELAWAMADALADCGEYRSATAHLRAAEARAPLPAEYGRKCSVWEQRHGIRRPGTLLTGG